jgi:hypothetical protein
MEKSDSDSGSYGEYNEDSSSNDSSNDMAAFDGSDEEKQLDEPGLMRMTSQAIGREYTVLSINQTKLFSLLNSKILEVKERFEYVSLEEGLIL